MFRGAYRRSPRIVELDARKAEQARSQKKDNVIYEVIDEEELDEGQDILKRKRGRKKAKVRTVQDLVVNSVEYKVQKTATGNDEDCLMNAAIVTSGAAIPEKSKLELLLGILQRRDTNKIFAEPVNPEEVKYYYAVIKEPMDFGTIAKKLNEGSYQTLEQFEHDVFLVPNNAMLFNASNTVYYRQARALKELATRLFHALKTDPENFEAEASVQRMGLGRRTKAEVRNLNCNSNNKNNSRIAARGYRAQRGFDDSEVEKRQTYRPWNSFLSANGSLVSAVYKSPQQLELAMQNAKVGRGYVESLKRFTKDLGPTAQMVARKKIESYISQALKVFNETNYRQICKPEMQLPNALFASNVKVPPPSFQVPSSTLGCQNISGNKDMPPPSFQVPSSTLGCQNISGKKDMPPPSFQVPSSTLGCQNISGKKDMPPPSFQVPSSTLGCQNISGNKDMHSGFSNGGQASRDDSMNINIGLNGGISQPISRAESLGDFQENMTQSVNSGFAPSLHLGNSNRYQTFGGGTMHGRPSFWNGGRLSAVNNKDINDTLNKGKGKLVGCPHTDDALNKGKGKLVDSIDFQEKLVQPMRGSLDSEADFSDYVANRSNGIHLDSSFLNYDSGKEKLDFTTLWNTKSNQKELGRTGMMVDAINVDNPVKASGLASSWSRMPESVPTGCASSNSWRPSTQVMTGLNSSQTVDYMSGIGSHFPDKGVYQKEAIAGAEGSRYRANAEQSGLFSELFNPLEMGPQPLTEDCFQKETSPELPDMESLLEQKKELESLCEAASRKDLLVSSPRENAIGASSNALEYERFQTRWRDASSRTAAADRLLKQPMVLKQLPQWKWL